VSYHARQSQHSFRNRRLSGIHCEEGEEEEEEEEEAEEEEEEEGR